MELFQVVKNALAEDLIDGLDLTCKYFVDDDAVGKGWIEARQTAVISGLDIAVEVFRQIDPTLELAILKANGSKVIPLEKILLISGKAASILKAERTALNFIGHLSGIATKTSSFVEKTSNYGTKILATRKTTPVIRNLEIQAVRDGGGDVYRSELSTAVLIKDNHVGILGGFENFKSKLDEIKLNSIEDYNTLLQTGKVEVDSFEQLEEAVKMGWKHILLDNFSCDQVLQSVNEFGSKIYLEVSGGVSETNLIEYASTKVNAISIGGITHSVKSADFSLEVEWSKK